MGAKRRTLWLRLSAAAIGAAVVFVLVYVGLSRHRNDLGTYLGLVAGLGAPAAGLITELLRRANNPPGSTLDKEELNQLADKLAQAVQDQWEKEAGERKLLAPKMRIQWRTPSAAMAGPAAAAVESTRFPPLPELDSVNEQSFRNGGDIGDLHAVYGGLGSGRLVIAGAPGSGKSGTAIWLILDALKHRDKVPEDKRLQVPVPVLFTIHDWEPTRQFEDWLIGQLQQTYLFLAGKAGRRKAAALIAAKKVDVILDGLDEITKELRPVALRALNEQVTNKFRVVVLARSAEMVSAASRQVLAEAAAVELQDIAPEDAADYLTKVQGDPMPAGWRNLVDLIESDPESDLARALGTPLALTLVRDTYGGEDDIVGDLVAASNAADYPMPGDDPVKRIIDRLLDRVLRAAYPPNPSLPYDLPTAEIAFLRIAVQMNQDPRTYDLEWWQLPEWSPRWRRIVPAALTAGITTWVGTALIFGFSNGFWLGFPVAGLVGAAVGVRGPGWERRGRPPWKTGRIRLREEFLWLVFLLALAGVLLAGFVGGLLGWHAFRNQVGTVWGILAGLAFSLPFGILSVLKGAADQGNTSFASPFTSWQSTRKYGRVLGFVFGLGGGLFSGILLGLTTWYLKERLLAAWRRQGEQVIIFGERVIKVITPVFLGPFAGLGWPLALGVLGGIFFGLVSGLVASTTFGTWASSVASVELAVRWRIPVRLMPFLKDAYKRGVLRTVGPVYQFRHSQLQDRLASGAYLKSANLTRRYLKDLNLEGADLRGADLEGADLRGANLSRAYLKGAYLKTTRLRSADLTGADLTGADLTGADLTRADLTGAWWSSRTPIPEGWERATDSGRLTRRTDFEPTEGSQLRVALLRHRFHRIISWPRRIPQGRSGSCRLPGRRPRKTPDE